MKTFLVLSALLVTALLGVAGWAWWTHEPGTVATVPIEVTTAPGRRDRPAEADPDLLEIGKYGPLPRIGPGGKAPRSVYARALSGSHATPRIAIVIGNLGLRRAQTASAIRNLPGVVTLAFSPYGTDLPVLARDARRAGHEILLALPLARPDPDRDDAGPRMISPALSPDSNLDRLHWTMSRMTGYVGLIGHPTALDTSDARMQAVLADIGQRGLIYVAPPGTEPAATADPTAPRAATTLYLDDEPSESHIDAQFARAEAAARASGRALVVGEPYALTLRKVKDWIERLEDTGISVVPVTAIMDVAPRSSP